MLLKHCQKQTTYILIMLIGAIDSQYKSATVFHSFLSSQNHPFRKKSFRNTTSVSNSLDPDQTRQQFGMIWAQTVGKGYKQTTPVSKQSNQLAKSLSRHNWNSLAFILILGIINVQYMPVNMGFNRANWHTQPEMAL